MSNPCFSIILIGGILAGGLLILLILPALLRLLAALRSGTVQWPGPVVRDLDFNANKVRANLRLAPDHLFPQFILAISGLMAAWVCLLLTFLSRTPMLSGYIQFKRPWMEWAATLLVFVAGMISLRKALYHTVQVNALLSDLVNDTEPRNVDARSAESEYAIAYPLLDGRAPASDRAKALELYAESVRWLQDGAEMHAVNLYQEAMALDPSLHEHAREALAGMAHDDNPKEAGAIYYWLGIHSEYLRDWPRAATAYEKAINAFNRSGYAKRESRAHCNLGNVKMHMGDDSAMEEFEKAVTLNPGNGTAYVNIGRAYYLNSEPGDEEHEKALDAFANAILADPQSYGPQVIASLQQFGYTWKEDLEQITQKVERRRGQTIKSR